MAAAGGASALLVFPPGIYTFGQRPEMALEHFRRIADATDLPLIVFQYPLAGGQGYPIDTLERICDEVPTVSAIKDWCASPLLHERHIRAAPVARAAGERAHHAQLLALQLARARMQGPPFRERYGDRRSAGRALARGPGERSGHREAIHDRIYPTAEAFYADPFVDMHNRMKEALVLLGRLPRAVVRPPLVKLPAEEIERIRRALIAAGLLDVEGRRKAA